MNLLTTDFFSDLLTIILLDLVLAGDNAIVIAIAASHLPGELQKRRRSGAHLVPSPFALR